ncbi:MAG: SpoIVB peptidase [bacterium]|nr:SpoIVB peptidase [bacterium]
MNFKKIFNKLLIFLFIISIFIIPKTCLAYTNKVILGGQNLGIEVNSNGVLVVGFYKVGNASPGALAGLKIGDRIIGIDDTVINDITDLSFSSSVLNDKIKITYIRNGNKETTDLKLYKDSSGVYKTGLYVKDSIIGIGTLTFIDPKTNMYGALGHEIIEKTTGQKFEIASGKIFKSEITSITKSERNNPGEKNATYNAREIYGTITKNGVNGIFGNYIGQINRSNLIDVADASEIKLGQATIRTVISGTEVKEYEIEILKIYPNNETKNILFKVVDEELISKTGGIVQGMSGSPIIQNNKIVGAVTHVISDDATKGFGIFITTMLKEIED